MFERSFRVHFLVTVQEDIGPTSVRCGEGRAGRLRDLPRRNGTGQWAAVGCLLALVPGATPVAAETPRARSSVSGRSADRFEQNYSAYRDRFERKEVRIGRLYGCAVMPCTGGDEQIRGRNSDPRAPRSAREIQGVCPDSRIYG